MYSYLSTNDLHNGFQPGTIHLLVECHLVAHCDSLIETEVNDASN